MKRFKLRNKFVLLLIVVSLTPLILTVALTYFRFQRTLEQHASQLQNQLSATAAVEIKSFIISQVGILETIATVYNPEFTTNSKEVTKILENILYKSDNFTTISIVDKKGQEIARQDRILVVIPSDFRDLSTTLAFNTVKEKGLYIGPIYIEGGKPSFDLGRWIVDAQGNFLGAVFAKVDAKIMPQVTSKISSIAGPGGRVYMVNEKGIVVAYSDFSYILGERDLSNLPTISNIISGNTDIKISQIYYNEKDDYVLGSAYPIIIEPLDIKLPEPYKINWFVITEQPTSEVFAEIYSLALYSVLLSLLVVLIAIAVAVFFARRISNPVENLYTATLEFGKGNLTYRANINTNDEIEDLANSFNEMAGTLSKSIKDLRDEKEKLKQRAEELKILLEEQHKSAKLVIRRDLELSRANEKLRENDKIKTDFISVVAHQLRTPLSGIKWTLNMLLNGDMGALNNDQKTFIMKSYESNTRMITLVNDMLVADGIQSGRVHYGFKHTDIIDLMDNVLFEISPQASKKKISIEYKNKFENLPQAYIDPETMRAVLQNLLENAVRYTMDGGKIEIDVKKEENYLTVSIADNGIGIPEDQQKNVFARFFRARNAIKQETDGSGLGLYITKTMVEKNGGTIYFKSTEGKGTTFYFSVPLLSKSL